MRKQAPLLRQRGNKKPLNQPRRSDPRVRQQKHSQPMTFAARWSRLRRRTRFPLGFLPALSGNSRKGAEGIAQFMPRTADWRGLIDPFDSIAALKASASYLRDLRNRFGNIGLAAAAYNAGPQRVQDWLVGRGSLPKETVSYIKL
jgi:hypothetical protein